jgi:phosphatidylinositol alpha-1,6-mannosyltransferase
LKILYLAVGVFDKGGISRYSRHQIRVLREAIGDENACVLSLLPPQPEGFEDRIEVSHSFGGFGISNELRYLQATVRASITFKPDLILLSHVRLLPSALIARKRSGAKLVVTVHGEEAWSGRLLRLHRCLLTRADHVVAVSRFTAESLAESFRLKPERVSMIHGCVDLARFEPRARKAELFQKYGIPDDTNCRYVLTLGRINANTRYKGYERLLDAIANIQRENAILLYAGTGNDVSRLRARVFAKHLESRVRFLGNVPEASLCDVYNLCDMFALVSERGPGMGEGLGLALLEAAACAKPLIVGNEDGARETIIENISGFALSPRDPEALRATIELLCYNDALRSSMGREGRRFVEREFSFDIFRRRTMAMIERSLAADETQNR